MDQTHGKGEDDLTELRWLMRGVAFLLPDSFFHCISLMENHAGKLCRKIMPEPLEFQTAMVSDEDHELQWQAMHYPLSVEQTDTICFASAGHENLGETKSKDGSSNAPKCYDT